MEKCLEVSNVTHHSHIRLAHGNGGRLMRELIEGIFARHLGNPLLDLRADAVPLPAAKGEIVVTTDAFTVQPLEFPGGDIGSLAVHGTVNDLAVAGAEPLYLTLSVIIEEGLAWARLDRIVAGLARAANAAEVQVVAGDTKVVGRGEGGGLYLATTGVGVRVPGLGLGLSAIRAGDRILVSGPVGDHGAAVLLARGGFGLRGDLASDCGSVLPLARAVRGIPGVRFLRDPTRGGLATVIHEICAVTGLSARLDAAAVPVRPAVRSLCELLGYDAYYLACEGRAVAVAAPEVAADVLARWRALAEGRDAAIIGWVDDNRRAVVTVVTEVGGERLLDELEDDPLPRIC